MKKHHIDSLEMIDELLDGIEDAEFYRQYQSHEVPNCVKASDFFYYLTSFLFTRAHEYSCDLGESFATINLNKIDCCDSGLEILFTDNAADFGLSEAA